jgi:hypothetical protein
VLEQGIKRLRQVKFAIALPAILLLASGVVTYFDFNVRWLSDPRVSIYTEKYINQPIDFIKQSTSPDQPVYFLPFSFAYRGLAYRTYDLAPRPVRSFDTFYCQVASDRSAIYVASGAYEPDYGTVLSRWSDVRVLQQGEPLPDGNEDLDAIFSEINLSYRLPPDRTSAKQAWPWYIIYESTPRTDWVAGINQPTAIFSDSVRLRLVEPISTTVHPGDVLLLRLGLKALHPMNQDLNIFAHLYGIPTPYEGGQMWSASDAPACPTYPANVWQSDETVLQDLSLNVPPDAPPGNYLIGLGIYDRESAIRLPLTYPQPQPGDYYPLTQIAIVAP